mmetsp:Transcript_28877/g.63600  ORF Transcript_28877/g.63600 Transcript_28877/m.63600 type:complete len:116 (-) Transcript_28877:1029-1376(-)
MLRGLNVTAVRPDGPGFGAKRSDRFDTGQYLGGKRTGATEGVGALLASLSDEAANDGNAYNDYGNDAQHNEGEGSVEDEGDRETAGAGPHVGEEVGNLPSDGAGDVNHCVRYLCG